MKELQTVSVADAGRMLGIGRSTAFALVHRNRIKSLRLGRKLRVPLPWLQRVLAGEIALEEVSQ